MKFEFSNVRPGAGTLILVYKRRWEATVAEQLEVHIVVEPESLGV